MPDGSLIASGNYRPTNGAIENSAEGFCPANDNSPAPAPGGPYANTMAAFNGDIARGDWKLFIRDDCAEGGGDLSQWRLQITTVTGAQTISWTTPASSQVGNTHASTATAINSSNGGPSGVPITYALGAGTTNSACTINGAGLITFNHPGNCRVTADARATADFSAFPGVETTVGFCTLQLNQAGNTNNHRRPRRPTTSTSTGSEPRR